MSQAGQCFSGFGLPVQVRGLKCQDILEATRKDKKMEAGKIKFVLLKRMGEAFVTKDITDGELLEAIGSVEETFYE